MNVFSELGATLRAFDYVQLLLAFLFVTGYAIALGHLFGPLGRRRGGTAALVAATAFVALTDPWMHGVLLVTAAVAGIGLFIVAAWTLSVLSERIAQRAVSAAALPADSLSAISLVPVLEDEVPAPTNAVAEPLRPGTLPRVHSA